MTFKNIRNNIEMLRVGSILQRQKMKWDKIIIFFLIIGYVSLNLRLKSTQYQLERMTEFMRPLSNDPRWVTTHHAGPPGNCPVGPTGPIGQPGPTGAQESPGKSGHVSSKPDDWDDDLDGRWLEPWSVVTEINHLKLEVSKLKLSSLESIALKNKVSMLEHAIKRINDEVTSFNPSESPKEFDAERKIELLMEKDMLLMNTIADINTQIRWGDGEARRSVESIAADVASKIQNLESRFKTDTNDSTIINYVDGRLLKLNKAIKDTDFDIRSFLVKELRALENAMSERLNEVVGRDGMPGPMGDKGDKGDKGDDGKDGEDGRPGECPFPVWQITQIVDKRLKEKISKLL
jgi:hypothetical protein